MNDEQERRTTSKPEVEVVAAVTTSEVEIGTTDRRDRSRGICKVIICDYK